MRKILYMRSASPCSCALASSGSTWARLRARIAIAFTSWREIGAIAVCGIQTNFCCETTARIGSDLGYDVWFVLDATHTFDMAAPDGEVVPAAEIARMTALNLQDEFAEVVTTAAACA